MALTRHTSQPKTQVTDAVLSRVVDLLVEAAHPQQIILFGSYARAEQTPESDLDLLVIESPPYDRFNEMIRLRRVLLPIPVPIDVLVYSEEDVRERGHWLGTVLHGALQEGRVLYAASEDDRTVYGSQGTIRATSGCTQDTPTSRHGLPP